MAEQTPSERIVLRFKKFSGFVEDYGGYLSLGGMFLETEDLRPVSSIVDFEIKLTDGFRLIQGLGEVIWARQVPAGAGRPAGLGVRFQALDDKGRELILKILEERVRNGHEPFDVEEIPADLTEPPAAEPPVGDDPSAESQKQQLDVEQKILGEDGFTLIDTENGPQVPEVQTDEAFEELAFDAPWGEQLPELPKEVLEENLESGPAAAGSVTPSEPAEPAPVLAAPEPESPVPVADFSEPADSSIPTAPAESPSTVPAPGPGDGTQDPIALAAQAASTIKVESPDADAFGEPDFDDIDFSVPPEAAGEAPASFEPEAPTSLDETFEPEPASFDGAFEPEPSASLDGAFELDSQADVDDAFDPDPHDQLPSPGLSAEPSFEPDDEAISTGGVAPAGEDPTFIAGNAAVPEEDSTLLTSESFADIGQPDEFSADDSIPTSGPELEAPVFDAPAPATEASFDEPFAPESFGSDAPAEVTPAPEVSDFGGLQEPVAEPPSQPDGSVTVAGAPVQVQDYEDDLFAEEQGSGLGQVIRQAASGRNLAVAALLAALVAGGYFFWAPIAELVGLGGPSGSQEAPIVGGPPAATEPPAAAETSPVEEAELGETPATGGVEVASATTHESGSTSVPGAGESPTPIEEEEVRQSLPPGTDVSTDPEADPGAIPTIEVEALRPGAVASAATKVRRIAWRRGQEGTRVTIELDGDLGSDHSVHETLDYNAAREMVRLVGIEEPYASGRIEVGTPELAQIRVGFHQRPAGAEIHVVFDYPEVGPRVAEVRRLGDRLEILISGS